MKEAIDNKGVKPPTENIGLLRFAPVYKSVIWGGNRIGIYKGVELNKESVGESWEISAIPGHETLVNEGPLKGRTLGEIMSQYGERLIGKRLFSRGMREFPLLIKFIDARSDLSIQVHPGEEIARSRHNCPGKSEMWYIINSLPDSNIISGFSVPITREEYRRKVANGEILESVAIHETNPGDVFFIPSGRVHAIGGGNFLLEVQQSSDITYRIYDYNRRDKDGTPRPLHTSEAAEAIDYRVYDNYKIEPREVKPGVSVLVQCPVFEVRLLTVNGQMDVEMPDDSFLTMTCVEGSVKISSETDSTELKCGHTVLIPAEQNGITLSGKAKIIAATC